MAQNHLTLTEKEKHTLRLLLEGHDAKSMAQHLGLSVHTVNERLRDARRKMSATSSREAARLLRQAEAAPPDLLVDKPLGDAGNAPGSEPEDRPDAASSAKHHAVWAIGGFAMISLVVALLAVSPSSQPAPDPAPSGAAATAPVAARSAASQAALQWLELVDAGKWEESWAATTQSFQSLNTVERWRSASQTARVPLGRVLTRSITSEEGIPGPPSGYQLIRLRTSFANKAGATETLSLAYEGGSWRVVGYYIE